MEKKSCEERKIFLAVAVVLYIDSLLLFLLHGWTGYEIDLSFGENEKQR